MSQTEADSACSELKRDHQGCEVVNIVALTEQGRAIYQRILCYLLVPETPPRISSISSDTPSTPGTAAASALANCNSLSDQT
jgi:hypothetical protein